MSMLKQIKQIQTTFGDIRIGIDEEGSGVTVTVYSKSTDGDEVSAATEQVIKALDKDAVIKTREKLPPYYTNVFDANVGYSYAVSFQEEKETECCVLVPDYITTKYGNVEMTKRASGAKTAIYRARVTTRSSSYNLEYSLMEELSMAVGHQGYLLGCKRSEEGFQTTVVLDIQFGKNVDELANITGDLSMDDEFFEEFGEWSVMKRSPNNRLVTVMLRRNHDCEAPLPMGEKTIRAAMDVVEDMYVGKVVAYHPERLHFVLESF